MTAEEEPDLRWNWRKMFQYFLQGLIILAPIIITIWAVLSLFIFIDNILPNFINFLFPDFVNTGKTGELKKIPGLGFLVVIILVILEVGYPLLS